MTIERILNNALKQNNRVKIENAFEIVYNDYAPLVSFVLYKYIKRREDVEELVLETFLKFYKACFNVSINNIKAYLVTIAKNCAINFIKKSKDNFIYDDELVLSYCANDNNDYSNIIEMLNKHLDESSINIIILHDVYDYTFNDIA